MLKLLRPTQVTTTTTSSKVTASPTQIPLGTGLSTKPLEPKVEVTLTVRLVVVELTHTASVPQQLSRKPKVAILITERLLSKAKALTKVTTPTGLPRAPQQPKRRSKVQKVELRRLQKGRYQPLVERLDNGIYSSDITVRTRHVRLPGNTVRGDRLVTTNKRSAPTRLRQVESPENTPRPAASLPTSPVEHRAPGTTMSQPYKRRTVCSQTNGEPLSDRLPTPRPRFVTKSHPTTKTTPTRTSCGHTLSKRTPLHLPAPGVRTPWCW